MPSLVDWLHHCIAQYQSFILTVELTKAIAERESESQQDNLQASSLKFMLHIVLTQTKVLCSQFNTCSNELQKNMQRKG